MPLTAEPVASGQDPFNLIVAALESKLGDTNLSFCKFLTAQGTPLKNIYTQRGSGGSKNAWDPVLSKCPAIILLASAFPSGEDHGIGDERWFFSVTVMFKMRLDSQDATPAFQASYELLRTIFAGWRTPQLDPIGSIPGLCDYEIDGNVTPHIADEDSGRAVAKLAFDVRFRFNKNILGGGV
jgi:hypothetical protein